MGRIGRYYIIYFSRRDTSRFRAIQSPTTELRTPKKTSLKTKLVSLDTTYCGNPHSPSDYIFGVLILSTPKRRKHSVDRKKCRIWRHQTYHLPDNTTVWLNAGSTIIYPEEFIGRFRQIFFTGEGHFSVAKNKEKPFIIKSNESSIEVLGTQFNLKSYSNDNRIEVALLDGSVAFCYPSTTDQEMKCILSPGEQVYYNRTTHNLEKKNFILSDYSSWKDGKYYFKNETLKILPNS